MHSMGVIVPGPDHHIHLLPARRAHSHAGNQSTRSPCHYALLLLRRSIHPVKAVVAVGQPPPPSMAGHARTGMNDWPAQHSVTGMCRQADPVPTENQPSHEGVIDRVGTIPADLIRRSASLISPEWVRV